MLGSSTGEGLGQLQAKPTQARALGKEQDVPPAWAFHALALCVYVPVCVCTRPHKAQQHHGQEGWGC